jgi:hypothetical protein
MDGEAAEQIAGEQGKIELLDPIGPSAPGTVKRQELFVTLTAQGCGGQAFKLGLDAEGVPTPAIARQFRGRRFRYDA